MTGHEERTERGRILAAASSLVAQEGLGTSMTEIAEHAGITRMTLYRRFGTREQLLVALLVHESSAASHRLAEVLDDRTRPFADRLVEAVMSVVATVRQSPVLTLFVERITPTEIEELDPGGVFLTRVWAFLQPYFDDPEVRPLLRADPERSLDWTLRQILLQLVVHGRTNQSESELRAELRTFFVPSVLTDRASS